MPTPLPNAPIATQEQLASGAINFLGWMPVGINNTPQAVQIEFNAFEAATPVIVPEVVGLQTGANPTVVQTGPVSNPTFTFGIPAGPVGASSYAAKAVTAPYTLTAADSNRALTVDTSAGGIVTIPQGLPTNFSCLLTQGGVSQIVVTPVNGVGVSAWQNHIASAGQFSQIVLDATAQDTYLLSGNTATSSATAPPVLVPFNLNVAGDTVVGTQLFTVQPVGDTSGAVYSITAGNTAGYFAINTATGFVSLVASLVGATAGPINLTIQGVDPYGTSTEVGTVTLIPAAYNPTAQVPVAWLQPRNPASAGLVDANNDGVLDSYGFIADVFGSGITFAGKANTATNPRPTIGQFNGLSTAYFSVPTSALTGSATAKSMTNGATYFGIEMVLSVDSITANNAIFEAILTSGVARIYLKLNTSGGLVLQTTRLDTDAVVTITGTTSALAPGFPHYLYVGINYQTGAVILQVDELVEPVTAFWSSGTGAVSATNLNGSLLGETVSLDNTTINVAECTFYSTDPGDTQRASNLSALRTTYGIPAYSPGGTVAPVLPTTPTAIQIGTDTPSGTLLANYASTSSSGHAQYAIASGNSSGDFAFGLYSANLVLAKTAAAGVFPLSLTANNTFGNASPLTVTVTIVTVTYNATADGAWAWLQPRNGTFTTSAGGTISAILDRGGSGRGFTQATTALQPALTPVGFNNFPVATFSGGDQLVSNTAMQALANATTYLGFEFCMSMTTLAAIEAIFKLTTTTLTAALVTISTAISTGKISLSTRRLAADTVVTNNTVTAALTAGGQHYVYVGVNFATGAITIQVDGTIETFTAAWSGGTGTTAAENAFTGGIALGATSTIPATAMVLSEMAIYRTDPGATLRANHRTSFQATYGTP